MLLTQQHVQDKVKIKTQAQLVVVDTEWTGIQKRSKESPGVSPDPHRLMYMIFTSGGLGTIFALKKTCNDCGRLLYLPHLQIICNFIPPPWFKVELMGI